MTASAQGPRVAIIGVWLESNRQAPVAKEEDFTSYYRLEGDAIMEAARADFNCDRRLSEDRVLCA